MSTEKSQYSPMMQHYLQLKEENPEPILMYRLGDFYEMFFEDAKICSRELDLVLTGRAAGKEKAPMCGVPHHSVQSYISRLIKKGYKVAICEQLEDPSKAKGLVERGIVRIITPGTWMEENLNDRSENYMAVLHTNPWQMCLIFCDLSTGKLKYEILEKSLSVLNQALAEMKISELVYDRSVDKSWIKALGSREDFVLSLQKAMPLSLEDESLLPMQDELLENTLQILIGYIQKTQMQHADHLMKLELLHDPEELVMDADTRSHLELIRTQSTSSKAKSLWEFMDRTLTSMGSRMLKNWIESPLTNVERIRHRQEAVQILLDQFLLRDQLRDHLDFVYDMERLAARISYGSASPRDVLQLIESIEHAAPILELSKDLHSCYPFLQTVDDCSDLYHEIHTAIQEDPPLTLKEGNVFAKGYNEKLDELRVLADESSQAILNMEMRERERTGIKNLKIGYNRVFGYYIDIRQNSVSMVKDEYGYTPRQTLSNSTRFVTDELKDLESRILSAQEQKVALEQELFDQLLNTIRKRLNDLHTLAKAMALIDVSVSLASIANDYGYVRPIFNSEHRVDVEEGKHPVLEQMISGYISNNWKMDTENHIQIITGPNMGGKSTWLRQNALLVIMAQMGSFVPARKAEFPIFKRIFTRIGANDDLMKGKSTFMVEMMEANEALQFADENSLILFDEIGRGTSTYDGMALAQAMIEYFEDAIKAKTLFSTHYHELTDLENQREGIKNVHADVKEKDGQIEFRYRITEGKSDKSYGIHVAELAKLPDMVITRAEDLLKTYEEQDEGKTFQPSFFVMEKSNPARNELLRRMEELDVDALSPRQALDCLYQLKNLSNEAVTEK
ncbi:DNA mismatch repair protein MutS [Ileibacterium valens]|uniref:DNA mismatch repair protein MutS n=1 Tax=Ileibacterium valens TaxID=1862668 RepID=UPI002356555C|nr:DNA mismatch repair protein MutS [Ileibacterium valens]